MEGIKILWIQGKTYGGLRYHQTENELASMSLIERVDDSTMWSVNFKDGSDVVYSGLAESFYEAREICEEKFYTELKDRIKPKATKKLFVLERDGYYDEVIAVAIVAGNENSARILAASKFGPEWALSKHATCVEVDMSQYAVILTEIWHG